MHCKTFKISYTSSLMALFMIFLLTACEPPKQESETERFERDLKSFNSQMDNLGQQVQLLESMQNELDQLEKQRASGDISDEEFKRKTSMVKDTYGRALAKREPQRNFAGLPSWAIELGLSLPNGMQLDQGFSQITSVNNPDEGFNSVLLVFNGDYQTAMQEASRIARQARVPLSKDFEEAREIAQKYSSNPLKGIAYMNFEPFKKDAPVNISITVDETGVLTISAVDVQQMNRQLERGRNINTPAP
ncbi:MAG TPA: SHOCT domain-containing protein [Bacteroidales bacterium]|nr:SHOCT domain-containing protein [Bacteroidales bacterium]